MLIDDAGMLGILERDRSDSASSQVMKGIVHHEGHDGKSAEIARGGCLNFVLGINASEPKDVYGDGKKQKSNASERRHILPSVLGNTKRTHEPFAPRDSGIYAY